MKRLISVLLVLAMALALTGAAMAECKFEHNDMACFKCDANAYTAAKDSKKTGSVVQKNSVARVICTKGKFVKLRVNEMEKIDRWFKAADLKKAAKDAFTNVVWAKGGKGMSSRDGESITLPELSGVYVKVSGHTNLRRTPSLHCKSQAVVEKCDLLKMTGRFCSDTRGVLWIQVRYDCKNLWLSRNFVACDAYAVMKFYDKDGKRIFPFDE